MHRNAVVKFIGSIILFLNVISLVSCANILLTEDLASPSHQIWNYAIADALVAMGHNVTILGPKTISTESKKFHFIPLEGLIEATVASGVFQPEALMHLSVLGNIKICNEFSLMTCNHTLHTKGLQKLIDYPKDFQFDLIILDLTVTPCFLPLIERFNSPPAIMISAMILPPVLSELFGNSFPVSYIPYILLKNTARMNFLERLNNFIYYEIDLYWKAYSFSTMEQMSRRVFGENMQSLDALGKKPTFLLCNLSPGFHYSQPLTPNIIPVGGLHIVTKKKLPQLNMLRKVVSMRLIGPIILFLNASVSPVSCANILITDDLASPSHQIWNYAIADALVARGHNVTVLGPKTISRDNKKFHFIPLEGLIEATTGSGLFLPETLSHLSAVRNIQIYNELSILTCNHTLHTEGLQELINYPADFKFDLIILDLTVSPCLLPLIERFNTPPAVAISAFLLPPFLSETFGNSFPVSYVPYILLENSARMNFLERLQNFIYSNIDFYWKTYFSFPVMEQMSREVFGENMQSLDNLGKKAAFLLCNLSPGFHYSQPLTPNIIPVGGLHIDIEKKLPRDLQDIMDSAKNGVILFSLGTNVRSDKMSSEKRNNILKAFSKMNQTVLWKFESNIKNYPNNVIIRKWTPQTEILAHPNLKLFITHGGGLSTIEAAYYGIPMVGIPFFVDQYSNMELVETREIGVTMDYETLTSESLVEAVNNVLTNPKTASKNMTIYKNTTSTNDEEESFCMFFTSRSLQAGMTDGFEFLNGAPETACQRIVDIWSSLTTVVGFKKDHNDMDSSNKWNVNEINEFFLNAVPKLTPDEDMEQFYKHNIKKSVHTTFTFQPVSETDILNIVKGIKSKAVGPDGIRILTSNLYLKNARRISSLMKDQPQTSMERALFWIEFAMRNNGTNIYDPESRHISGFISSSFDIYLFLLLILCLFLYSLSKVLSVLWILVINWKQKKVKMN